MLGWGLLPWKFLVNRKMRLNFYKQTGRTDGLWSGEMFEKLIQSIENPMPSVMITNNLNMNSNHYNLNINLNACSKDCMKNKRNWIILGFLIAFVLTIVALAVWYFQEPCK